MAGCRTTQVAPRWRGGSLLFASWCRGRTSDYVVTDSVPLARVAILGNQTGIDLGPDVLVSPRCWSEQKRTQFW